MSSVFGNMTVISIEKTENNNFVYKCYDSDYKNIIEIEHKERIPVGTKIYWEDFLKKKEFFWCMLDNPEINSVIKY